MGVLIYRETKVQIDCVPVDSSLKTIKFEDVLKKKADSYLLSIQRLLFLFTIVKVENNNVTSEKQTIINVPNMTQCRLNKPLTCPNWGKFEDEYLLRQVYLFGNNFEDIQNKWMLS